MRPLRWKLTSVLLAGLLLLPAAGAARIKDLCEIQGARGNTLKGVGIVVGLAGTGDKTGDALRRMQRMLDRMNIDVEKVADLKSDNVAVVMVDATLPAFAKEGTRIDVRVSAVGDAESLEGGTLLETYLYGPGTDETVYAVAQGPLSVGGFNADAGGGTSVRKNHVTVGRVPMGAYVEQEVPSTITDGDRVALLLRRPDFRTAENIRVAADKEFGEGGASALSASTITVRIPQEMRPELIGFIAKLQDLEVVSDLPTRVVINERTGTIVVGGDVMIKPCEVAHGNLSIQIATTPVVSQPAPLSPGVTVTDEVADMVAVEQAAFLMPVQGTSASDVAAALNKLKVTPRDMISIFQALRESGAMDADLEIM
ncbi:MAG: flagellar basal body P-ring protein FlgI [Candidatus Hydrogenedentales bacterium]